MEKLLALALAGACSAASAQTPANNPMPDGSRDMYVGLGAVSAPEWDGARHHRLRALPVLQVQWSNGVFVSGMSAGMHLSANPTVEFGPLLAVQAGRDESGTGGDMAGIEGSHLSPERGLTKAAGRLSGMSHIGSRLEAGGFYNYYVNERLRLTTVLAYGAGKDRDGLRYTLDLQHLATALAPRHKLSASVGLTFVNRAHNNSYFGVSMDEAVASRNHWYEPEGGLRDVHAGVRWNYALSPAWMLATSLKLTHLRGDAARSPLVERSTNHSVSTALAYRF